MSLLDQAGEIVVEGQGQDQFVFRAGSCSFKLRGIFLPTTMLVTPALGSPLSLDLAGSNQKPGKLVSKVLLGTPPPTQKPPNT